MLGHTFFRVGYPFYFNLSSLSLGAQNDVDSLAARLGIGGYYQCNKINYVISPSEFITKINAIYMGNKKKLVGKKEKIGSEVPDDKSPEPDAGFFESLAEGIGAFFGGGD